MNRSRAVGSGLASAIAFAVCASAFAAEEEQRGVAAAAAVAPSVAVRLPKEEKVVYRGVVSFDAAGAGGMSMMYPAPNAAGLLAAVITHAILADSAQAAQRKQIQDAADKVLIPYDAVLGSFTSKDLMTRALQNSESPARRTLVDASDDAGADLLVETAPVFSMTQDQRALVLDAVLTVSRRGAAPAEAARQPLRVVSRAIDAAEPLPFWTANDGEKLKHESAMLLAHALDVALSDALSQARGRAGPERTFRYLEGGSEKMERAQLVLETCDRAIVKTLRAELMSIPLPASRVSADAGCAREKRP